MAISRPNSASRAVSAHFTQGGQADSMLNAIVTDIMSDWWATHSGAPAVNAGLDASALSVIVFDMC